MWFWISDEPALLFLKVSSHSVIIWGGKGGTVVMAVWQPVIARSAAAFDFLDQSQKGQGHKNPQNISKIASFNFLDVVSHD